MESLSDRELLEMAAKAAGFAGLKSFDGSPFYVPVSRSISGARFINGSFWMLWNPLADDGDALRLAVDLQLCTSAGELACAASWPPHSAWLHEVVEKHSGDKHAATRLAIVRAAAAIGASMQ